MRNTQYLHPNFFIIGAPKSGTTALSEYLRQHPNVLFSQPKEPHFFNDDFSHRYIDSADTYLECFSHGTGLEQAVGEGSIFYLYSKTAVGNLLRKYPHARFIVMLRDPVEAVYSWHWQAMYSHGEDLTNFEEAWRAQGKRQRGDMLPPHNRVREALQYGSLFSYANQLKHLFAQVPKERVHVILYDDFRKDTETCFQKTLQYLQLSPFSLQHYERINLSKRVRWPWAERVVRAGGSVKRAIGINRGLGALTRLQRLNTKYQERPPIQSYFRAELIDYFSDDIRQTAELINRDLTGWGHG